MKSILTKNQKRVYGVKFYTEGGERLRIRALVRHDDECGNGHNSFSITGEIERKKDNGQWYWQAGGCLHDEIAKHFPELAPFIKWHLTDTTGPMHYIANTLYHAGNRDCYGLLKGEIRSYKKTVKFKGFPFTFDMRGKSEFLKWLEALKFGKRAGDFEILEVEHGKEKDGYKFAPKYTFSGFPVKEWHRCPFDDRQEAEQWKTALLTIPFEIVKTPDAWGEGKERDLNAARACAVWPEATDAELCSPDLKAKLEARLPAMLKQFKKDVESLGFTF